MPHYRIYRIDALGRIAQAQDATCDTDSEALALAASDLAQGERGEVWRTVEFVGALTCTSELTGAQLAAAAMPAAPLIAQHAAADMEGVGFEPT